MEPMMINTAVLDLFKKKVQKANNKAVKLGLAPVVVTYGTTSPMPCGSDTIGAYRIRDAAHKATFVALYTEVFLDGEAPVINGWRFVATVDLRGEAPMVRAQPYSTVDLSKFHDTDGHCDHCNTTRFRNDVLVLENVETGELMQIGRACAADFFRSSNAASLLACSDWVEAYGNVTDPQGRSEGVVTVSHLFAQAAAVVRKFGWVSSNDVRADSTLTSTKGRVWNNLFPYRDMPLSERAPVTEEDDAEAEIVVAWLRRRFLDKPVADCSDFERNVKAAVEGQSGEYLYVRHRNLNYLIWGIAGYARDLQKEAQERARLAALADRKLTSDFVGTVGDRIVLTALKLEFRRAFGSDFGIKYLNKFSDKDGNQFVWWGTNDVASQIIVGNTYEFKATIKAHEERDGVKQTVLTRAALINGELKADK